jgi:hypothetical protein
MAFSRKQIIEFSIFTCLCAFAWAMPRLIQADASSQKVPTDFPGWPAAYEGQPLEKLPLTEKEAFFLKDFPGQVGRFTDGKREIIIRWVSDTTRQLHPAYDCFKNLGYSITPKPVMLNQQHTRMGCFAANKEKDAFLVCEYIQDPTWKSWSDVQSWYWDAFLGNSNGGWWSYVVASKV